MAAQKSFTQICRQLSDAAEALSEAGSQHTRVSSGSGSTASGSRSGPSSRAPSVHEAIQEAIESPLRQTSTPFDDIPQQPFEDPIPQPAPVPDVEIPTAQPSQPSPLRQSPVAAAPSARPVQRRVAKQQAAPRSPIPRAAEPIPAAAVSPQKPASPQQSNNRPLLVYVLIPALAFVGTYFGAPLIVPSFFENKITGEHDRKKALLAATIIACGATLAARCVL